MLPPNLLIVSMVVFLTTTVSTAPVEEKEREEVEVEATEEVDGELSEEEEGIFGMQQTTLASAPGGSVSGGQLQGSDAAVERDAATGSSTGSAGSLASEGSPAAAVELSDASAGQSQSAGSDGVDSESNANGQKLLNGGRGGGGGGGGAGRDGADSQTAVFGGGISHLDYAGITDPSSHNFLLGLMGDMTPPTQLDPTVISSGATAVPSTGQDNDSPADHILQSDISTDQSGADYTPLSTGPDQLLSIPVSGSAQSAHAAAAPSSPSSHSDTHKEQTGNGRQTLLTDTRTAKPPTSFNDLQTDLTAGGVDSVTGQLDLTVSGLGLGHDVTESVGGITQTLHSGVYSHTDLVTVVTDFTGTETISADPTGSPLDSSHPAVTDNTKAAGSVTEQYNSSGQGPEGAENVELEDTC